MEPTRSVDIEAHRGGGVALRTDEVAVEAPLAIRVRAAGAAEATAVTVGTTMRTPGDDTDLALGFLVAEGVLRNAADVANAVPCGADAGAIRIELAAEVPFDPGRFARHGLVSSACGACGRSELAAFVEQVPARLAAAFEVEPELLMRLPGVLRAAQPGFARTGGLHAAGLFDLAGNLLLLREDVGRHNALDKLIGAMLARGLLQAPGQLLMLSGRASFELLQKAAMAGLALVAAVGAPSSLAIDVAQRAGITLVGFLGEGRCNVYANPQRLRNANPARAPRSSLAGLQVLP